MQLSSLQESQPSLSTLAAARPTLRMRRAAPARQPAAVAATGASCLHDAVPADSVAAGSAAMVEHALDSDAPFDGGLDSAALLRGQKVIEIAHNGFVYRLQATKQGKLILTK